MASADRPDLLTLTDAAARLGVHYMTAYRYVRTGKLPAVRDGAEWRVAPRDIVELLATGARPRPRRGSRAAARTRLEARMIAGDETGAWAVVEGALTAGAIPADIHVKLLGPCLASVGSRWEAGEVTIAEEHRATGVAQRIVGRLGPRFARRGRTRGAVVLGAVAGELHALPNAMLADLVRGVGFEAIDLGANTPPESFVEIAQTASRLVAVMIGATTSGRESELARVVTALREVELRAPILVGGASVRDRAHARALGADGWTGPDGATAVAVIEGLAEQVRR